jgi:ribosomal protein L40E
MKICEICGLRYPNYGNGCWKCHSHLRAKSNRIKNREKKIPRMVEGYEEATYYNRPNKPYVYMGDGVYIHPDDAWW